MAELGSQMAKSDCQNGSVAIQNCSERDPKMAKLGSKVFYFGSKMGKLLFIMANVESNAAKLGLRRADSGVKNG